MRASLISERTRSFLSSSSWIRKIFEVGAERKRKFGAQNVFDYSLGNPVFDPPDQVLNTLRDLTNQTSTGLHGYMSNAGFEDVRAKIAEFVTQKHSLKIPLTAVHIMMACGAAGALNVIFKSILNPGEQVLVPSPYFVEYKFYADNYGGELVAVPTRENFQLDLNALHNKISPQTKAILINSPNNPAGVIYPEKTLQELAGIIEDKEAEFNRQILLISDEPYAKILYEGVELPSILQIFKRSVLVTSHSKDLGLAGERIGYLVINPASQAVSELFNAFVFSLRTLGFINAPASMQKAVAGAQELTVGLDEYRQRRDLLYAGLTRIGYEVEKPLGTFYMFPKSPLPDDTAFVNSALEKNLLIVPGTGFNAPGYFRISFSSISLAQIKKSLEIFELLYKNSVSAVPG